MEGVLSVAAAITATRELTGDIPSEPGFSPEIRSDATDTTAEKIIKQNQHTRRIRD